VRQIYPGDDLLWGVADPLTSAWFTSLAETQLSDVPVSEGLVDSLVAMVTIEVAARIATTKRTKTKYPLMQSRR
jgi:hypothetical protein